MITLQGFVLNRKGVRFENSSKFTLSLGKTGEWSPVAFNRKRKLFFLFEKEKYE